MNVKHSMDILHSFSIRHIFFDRMNLMLVLFSFDDILLRFHPLNEKFNISRIIRLNNFHTVINILIPSSLVSDFYVHVDISTFLRPLAVFTNVKNYSSLLSTF